MHQSPRFACSIDAFADAAGGNKKTPTPEESALWLNESLLL